MYSELEFEVVIVDDASPDNTTSIALHLQKIYGPHRILVKPRKCKLGLGSAYIHALQFAKGEYICVMDADLSHHPKYIPLFHHKIRGSSSLDRNNGGNNGNGDGKGCDIVTGTRYAQGGGVYGWSLKRKLTSRTANYLASVLLQPSLSDLTGSFRLYKRHAFISLVSEVRGRGYVFQMEMMVRARYQFQYKVEEVGVEFVDRVYGESKLGVGEVVQYLKGLAWLFLTV